MYLQPCWYFYFNLCLYCLDFPPSEEEIDADFSGSESSFVPPSDDLIEEDPDDFDEGKLYNADNLTSWNYFVFSCDQ
jgi:hypothetical protein